MSRYKLSNSSPFGFGPVVSTGWGEREHTAQKREGVAYDFFEFAIFAWNLDGIVLHDGGNDLRVLLREPAE